MEASGICLCSSEAGRLGDVVWDTQKLPGAEIGEPFRKGACPSHPASILDSWLEAVCPSALKNGPRHSPTGDQAAALLGLDCRGRSCVRGPGSGASKAAEG